VGGLRAQGMWVDLGQHVCLQGVGGISALLMTWLCDLVSCCWCW
jgi:hypothetical protein